MSHTAVRVARRSSPATAPPASKQPGARPKRTPSDLALRSGAVPRMASLIQAKLAVNRPGDAYERQADAVADQVMRMPLVSGGERKEAVSQAQNPRALQRQPCASCDLRRAADSHSPPDVSPRTAATIRNPGVGQPLAPALRSRIEPHVGADLGHVRVHSDPAASQAAISLQARAFTHQNHIFLRSSSQSSNLQLMAHEATHVAQQGAAPVQRVPTTGERPPDVQRSWLDDLASGAGAAWDATGGALVDATGAVVDLGAGFFWTALETAAPAFAPILRQIQQQGIRGYLGGIIRETFGGMFDRLAGEPGAFDQLVSVFTGLAGQAGAIVSALASGGCQPLFGAIGQMKTMLELIASDVWNGITDFFSPIGDFFSGLWQGFGAPVIDWLSAAAGDVWQGIQNLGSEIWAWTQPFRDNLAAGWEWVKEQLFGSTGGSAAASAESSGGLVGWVTDMAGQAWEGIQRELEPVIAPIQSFAESVGGFLPMAAIRNMRDSVIGFLGSVQNMTQNLGQPEDAVANQATLRDEVLPAVLSTIGSVAEAITGAGGWIAAQIGLLAQTVTGMLDSLRSNSLLGAFAGTIGWVQEAITRIYAWEQAVVASLFSNIGNALVNLAQFIEPVLNALQQLVNVAGDLVGQIGGFITGIWNRIPACIREPLQQFLTEQILSRIPLFGQFMQIPDVFARVANTVMTVLRKVFVDGDLLGAMWTYFSALLELLGLPPDLVLKIISKAATAFRDILNDPLGFFLNLLRSLKQGFILFFDNIARHLLSGVTNWLFAELSEAGIQPPADLSLRSIIQFILDVLGITVDNFFERLGDKIGREKAQRIRAGFALATGAIRWLYRLVTEGPGALWEELKGQLSSLWSLVLDSIIGWLSRVIIVRGTIYLLGLLDPTFIMTVVNSLIALYNVIETFVRYIRQILDTVSTVLDGIGGIARGAIAQAAGFVEASLVRILPIAIAFLASLLGLGGLGKRIGEMVEKVREYVNKGIDWLIDRGVAAFNALLEGGKGVVGAVTSAVRNLFGFDERTPFDVSGSEHAIWLEVAGDQVETVVASKQKTPIKILVASLQARIAELRALGVMPPGEYDIARKLLLEILSDEGQIVGSPTLQQLIKEHPVVDESGVEVERAALRTKKDKMTEKIRNVFRILCRIDPAHTVGTAGQFAPVPETGAGQTIRSYVNVTVRAEDAAHALPPTEAGLLPGTAIPLQGGTAVRQIVKDPGTSQTPTTAGGALFQAAQPTGRAEQFNVQAITFNTGGGARESNISHAEHQFVRWFDAQRQDWRERVLGIEIRNDRLSPCTLCAGELADLGFKYSRINKTLFWRERYIQAPLATRRGDLEKMDRQGWIVHPDYSTLSDFEEMVTVVRQDVGGRQEVSQTDELPREPAESWCR